MVEARWPFAWITWNLVLRRLLGSGLSSLMEDRYFMLIHNILPMRD
jgi:hypothetical protein